jgi:hypothetical protein
MLPRSSSPVSILWAALLWSAGFSSDVGAQDPGDLTAQPVTEVGPRDLQRCEALHRVLTKTLGMAAEISPDTVDDERTRRILPGCRVTAVGSAHREVPGEENEVFYYTLFGAGWTRTPDPFDRPNEAAVRLRFEGADCFFTPYSGIRLMTDAEFRVNRAFTTRPGEERYSFLARCVEALPAAPN